MNSKAYILFFAIAATGLSSCQKTNGDAAPSTVTTTVSIVNASTDTLNFYQNGTRLNNTTNIYPFGSVSALSVVTGTQNYQLKKAGSTDILIDMPVTIAAKSACTFFVAGETADKVFVTTDTAVTDTAARIRFVNASPMSSNVDVYIGKNIVYKNSAFKSATSYVHTSSGKNALSIYVAGTTTLLAGGTLVLTAGTANTLYIKGVINGTGGNIFGARILNK